MRRSSLPRNYRVLTPSYRRDLDAGELLIMSYRSAAPYLEDGSMQLL